MKRVSIATLGGHSALEICAGAKRHNFPTIVIAQKGRERTYSEHFDALVDNCIIVDSFSDLTTASVIKKLQENNVIFIPHRYVQVYCNLDLLESRFPIPVFGNKKLLRYEEREGKHTQYTLMKEAGIPYPEQLTDPKKINSLVIVKVKEAKRKYERSFFFATNYNEYLQTADRYIREGKITRYDLESAIIEQYLIGVQVNFNFFYSPLSRKIELLGTDTRRQTNIDGLLRIPSREQILLGDRVTPSYIESGHIAVTVKESLLEKAFSLAERLIRASKKIVPGGIIGPFSLQSAILAGPPQEKIVVFDISLRMPGSPGTSSTPYSGYHFGRSVTFGERVAIEIQKAHYTNEIKKITT